MFQKVYIFITAVQGTVLKFFSEYIETKLNSGLEVTHYIDMEVLADCHGEQV